MCPAPVQFLIEWQHTHATKRLYLKFVFCNWVLHAQSTVRAANIHGAQQCGYPLSS
jgi:hypothetical protein